MPSKVGQSPQTSEAPALKPRLRAQDAPQRAGRHEGQGWHGLQRLVGNRALASLFQAGKGAGEAPLHPAVHATLKAPGRPLDSSIRKEMEGKFREDLSNVRVHADTTAGHAAKSVNARAFTVGDNVVFDHNQFSPRQESGKRLLAHELAHVLQQRRGGSAPADSPPTEGAAERAARAPSHALPHLGGSRVGVARQEGPEIAPPKMEQVALPGGGTEMRVDGVTVMTVGPPAEGTGVQTGFHWDSKAPKTVFVGVNRYGGTSARINEAGVATLQARGFSLNIFDNIQESEDLGERPWHVLNAPPPRPAAPRPRPKPKPTAETPKAAPPKKKEQKPPDSATPPPAAKQPAKHPVITMPEMVVVGEVPPPEADPTAETPPAPADLIDKHSDMLGLNLNEEALGADLLERAKKGQADYVDKVIEELPSTDRDDVSVAFAEAATDDDLIALTKTDKGRRLLDRLFDELTEGEVGADEQKQADRILGIKTRALLTPEEFAEKEERAKETIILPYKKPGLTVFTPAPISASRRANGKIWVKSSTTIFGTDYARDPELKLPKQIWEGIELEETDVIGLKLYDEGGQIIFVPALYLLQTSHENDRVLLHKAGEAVFLGATLGMGTVADAAGEGAVTATELTTAARVGNAVRTGLVVADRAALALDITNSIIQEHRGWIIETWGPKGRAFVLALDQVNSYAQIYMLGRGAVSLAKGGVALARRAAGLRKAYQEWRAAARVTKLEGDDLKNFEQISQETEKLLQNLEEAAKKPPPPDPPPSGPGGGVSQPEPPADVDVPPPAPEVAKPPARPELRSIEGGGQTTPQRQGHLRDVSRESGVELGEQELSGQVAGEEVEQQVFKKAANDPASAGFQPSMQRQGTGAQATAGGKRTGSPSAGMGRSAPSRTASSGGAGSALKSVPREGVAEVKLFGAAEEAGVAAPKTPAANPPVAETPEAAGLKQKLAELESERVDLQRKLNEINRRDAQLQNTIDRETKLADDLERQMARANPSERAALKQAQTEAYQRRKVAQQESNRPDTASGSDETARLRQIERESEKVTRELYKGSRPWRDVDLADPKPRPDHQARIGLYGELETTSKLQQAGAKPLGRTLNPDEIVLPQDVERTIPSVNKTGIDGIYEPPNKAEYDFWVMESKASGTPGASDPSGGVGKLEAPAGNRQLSDYWLSGCAGKSGLTPAQEEAFQDALKQGRVRRIYSTTDPKYGTRFFEVERVGEFEVKIGREITSEFVKPKP